jgi:hypothetical protein
VAHFKRGDFSTCVAPRPERPKTVITPEIIDHQVHQGVLVLARQCAVSPDTKKLAYLDFQCLDHLPYSPDPAPSDYHLFPGLKKQLKGRHFSSDMEVIAAGDLVGRTNFRFFLVDYEGQNNGPRSVLSFVGSLLKKSRV